MVYNTDLGELRSRERRIQKRKMHFFTIIIVILNPVGIFKGQEITWHRGELNGPISVLLDRFEVKNGNHSDRKFPSSLLIYFESSYHVKGREYEK